MSKQEKEKSSAERQGELLKKKIKDRGMTIKDMAIKLRISHGTLTSWFQGKSTPGLDDLHQIAKILRIETIHLIAYMLGVEQTEADVIRIKLLDGFSEMFGGFFGMGLSPDPAKKMAMSKITNKVNLTQSYTKEPMVYITKYDPIRNTEIYPRTEDTKTIMSLFDLPKSKTDEYYIVNGNICYKDKFIKDDIDIGTYYKGNISIYDYVNNGNSIKELKEAYERERYSIGMIGMLSAEDFYLLNYVIGYYEKMNQAE